MFVSPPDGDMALDDPLHRALRAVLSLGVLVTSDPALEAARQGLQGQRSCVRIAGHALGRGKVLSE